MDDPAFQVFDFHRIFLGDHPPLFLLEIVFRTLVMYGYTIILLRILGKRGMGQLSMLELAIIISFGSAIGDPMMGADIPILHGIVAVTAVTFFQIMLERLINKNPLVEAYLEGKPDLVVKDGVIQWPAMKHSNLSEEDLFRLLRGKDLKHLGQLERAYFETTGQISVMLVSNDKIKPGLPVTPREEIPKECIFNAPACATEDAYYSCNKCGLSEEKNSGDEVGACPVCKNAEWVRASDQDSIPPDR